MLLKKELDKVKRKKLLYSYKQPSGGTAFEVYTDGTLIVKTKITSNGLNIPKMAEIYFDCSKLEKKSQNIPTTWEIKRENGKTEVVQGKSKIGVYKNSYFIQQIADEGYRKIKTRIRATCTIQVISKRFHTSFFQKLAKLRDNMLLESREKLEPILFGGEKNTEFTIYRNFTGQLFIYSKVSYNQNKILLSDEIARYIENWHNNREEYFVCSFNEQPAMVVKAKSRPGNREGRSFKEIFFHIQDIPEESFIYFTNIDLKLSKNAIQDLQLKQNLLQKGYSIKQLTTNWLDKPKHKNENFASDVWTIIKQAFTDKEAKIFSEVKITCASKEEQTKVVDGLLVSEKFLGLIEIKTSEKIKNTVLDEVIGELALLQEQLGSKKNFILFFINAEVIASKLKKNITKLYGMEHNIILVGKKELSVLLMNPKLLLERVREHLYLLDEKSSQSQIYHPTELTLTSKESLEKQAYSLLEKLSLNSHESLSLIEQYCFLMNIEKSDFFKLYKLLNEQLSKKIASVKDLSIRRMLSSRHIFDCEILLLLHTELSLNSNYLILEEEKNKGLKFAEEYSILLRNWNVIMNSLPSMCRILGFKILQSGTGIVFERQVLKLLEREGYQVVSNVLLSLHGKHFEIDHLVFKNDSMEIISCKDRSHYQYIPNLYSKIALALGQVILYRRIFKKSNGQLFVRVKKSDQKELQKRFRNFFATNYSLVFTI